MSRVAPRLAAALRIGGAVPIRRLEGAPGYDRDFLRAIRGSVYRDWVVWVEKVPEGDLPVRPVDFGRLSLAERTRLAGKGDHILEHCREEGGHCLLGFVDHHADRRPEVVHDVLALLALRLDEEPLAWIRETLSWSVFRFLGLPESTYRAVARHFQPDVELAVLRKG